MYVTRHTRVNNQLTHQLWELYDRSYRRTAALAVTREQLFRSEFESVVADPSNRVWVVWADDRPVAMAVIATDVSATRYLSRAFLERQYPDHSREGRIHYILCTVVDERYAARGAIIRLAKGAFALEAEEGALVVFDTPQKNQPRAEGGLAELALRLGRMFGTAELHEVEVQRWFAIDFHGAIDDEEDPIDPATLADVGLTGSVVGHRDPGDAHRRGCSALRCADRTAHPSEMHDPHLH